MLGAGSGEGGGGRKGGERHVSAADYEDAAVADLPGEEEGAAGLDCGELGGGLLHWADGIYIYIYIYKMCKICI